MEDRVYKNNGPRKRDDGHDDVEHVITEILSRFFGDGKMPSIIVVHDEDDSDDDGNLQFSAAVEFARERKVVDPVTVTGVQSAPIYCVKHEGHRDGLLVGVLNDTFRDRARENTKNPTLSGLIISVYDGMEQEISSVVVDTETAKQYVNQLMVAIAAAEKRT